MTKPEQARITVGKTIDLGDGFSEVTYQIDPTQPRANNLTREALLVKKYADPFVGAIIKDVIRRSVDGEALEDNQA